MASNYTENFSLCQWEATDQILRTEFNEDHAKIDTALKTLSDITAGHSQAIMQLGNCGIWMTSYHGNGQYGQNNTSSLTFPDLPIFAIIGSDMGHLMIIVRGQYVVSGIKPVNSEPCFWTQVTWNENTVTWYSDSAAKQMNLADHDYYVLALLNAEE